MASPAIDLDLLRPADGGIHLRVRLTPKSSRDEIAGTEPTAEGPALKARVRAVPEDGQANAALEALVAKWLGVPKGTVNVTAGTKSRVKRVTVSGDVSALTTLVTTRLTKA